MSDGETLIKYAARVLTEVRQRYRRNGLSFPIELEALLHLLANAGQQLPEVAEAADNVLAMSYEDAGRRLGVSERTVRRLVASGELPRVQIGAGNSRIAVADLDAYVNSLMRERTA